MFDLDAGQVAITLPDAGKRFMSMQMINEDQYVPAVVYGAGNYTYSKEQIGTRYVMISNSGTLVEAREPEGMSKRFKQATGRDQGGAEMHPASSK